ncbi:glycine cleavage system protein GcvH [Nocardia aurantiaca]|uniref:Glycine cleavage system H protein n=1 Tax=Nocardia aurantiaca TaxID=2675850 RepID=A0A6I3L1V9_9NOCA|nr:glycine cleavage system protein GcvH [Nocardia aurantiaca]MTE14594.1 glycine cleavage system protein GcvH [Nocardia aurantiaca]
MPVTAVPEDLRYSEEHEWVSQVGPTRARVGITDYAQSQLGDVVFVQLPAVDSDVTSGDSVAEIESTKSVSDIYAPLSGKVVAVNDLLDGSPETVNSDAYGDGWLFEVEAESAEALTAALGKLLDAAGYQGVIGG